MKAIFTQLSVKDLESLLKEFCKGIKVFFFLFRLNGQATTKTAANIKLSHKSAQAWWVQVLRDPT